MKHFLRKSILNSFLLFIFTLSSVSNSFSEGLVKLDGGSMDEAPKGNCITQEQNRVILKNIEAYEKKYGKVSITDKQQATPEKYTFYPQAGRLWGDIFPNNFVDLDPTSSIQDFECTGYTYNGHNGIDSGILTWTQKDIGVPVYAALDGIVVVAVDGFFDEEIEFGNGRPSNHVVLDHGNGHRTRYFHLRKNSVAVEINDFVKAGQQLGDTASSGNSSAPHLHFETQLNSNRVETFSGDCNNVESYWEEQPPLFRQLYLREFNISNQDISSWTGPPIDTVRGAYFETGVQKIQWWISMLNLPENADWRVRFIRPDGSIRYDSGGEHNFSNSFIRKGWRRWSYNINFDTVGTWKVELTLDGSYTVEAPIEVVQSLNSAVNRPPNDMEGLMFSPMSPTPEDVVRCTVDDELLFRDPDYDQVRYRFEWKIAGTVVRDVTIAATSDVLAAGSFQQGDVIEVTVTPSDGVLNGNSITASPVNPFAVNSTVLAIY